MDGLILWTEGTASMLGGESNTALDQASWHPEGLGALIELALRTVAAGASARGGPLPAGGPAAVQRRSARLGQLLPEQGRGATAALRELTDVFVTNSVDPTHPWCAAHLHCPPLPVAAAADLVVSMLNPSMDSWDQAPAAAALEAMLTAELAALCYPNQATPDAVITSGGTESNQLGLLLARDHAEQRRPVVPVCGANAHHSVARAAWLLGMPQPIVIDCVAERMCPRALAAALSALAGPAVVVATAGTTDTGRIDPLPAIAAVARRYSARLHVDAAYGGPVLFSAKLAGLLAGVDQADTVALDLHKFGWQPIASGVLVAASASTLRMLHVNADYLNADDDTEAGLPDLLGRSLRTSRRADAFRIAVSLRALGQRGMAALVEHCCGTARELGRVVTGHPALRLWCEPALSTVLFRPLLADQLDRDAGDELVARVRRRLLETGRAVIGRARIADHDGMSRLWWKLTLLNPKADVADYRTLLDLLAATALELSGSTPCEPVVLR